MFKIDLATCAHCGGAVQVIASLEDPAVIKPILEHLERRAALSRASLQTVRPRPATSSIVGPEGTRLTGLPLTHAGMRGWLGTWHGVPRAYLSKQPIFPDISR